MALDGKKICKPIVGYGSVLIYVFEEKLVKQKKTCLQREKAAASKTLTCTF